MPSSFSLKEIRRLSFASLSFRTDRSADTSSNDDPVSSPEQSSVGSITPPSISNNSDPALHIQIPTETKMTPPLAPTNKRYSLEESTASQVAPTKTQQAHAQPLQEYHQPLAEYAPQVTNIRHGTTVTQKILLVTGIIGKNIESHRPVDGTLIVSRRDKTAPPTKWPVHGSRFKAMIHLVPGPNTLHLQFEKSGFTTMVDQSSITINMLEHKTAPPLQLAIVVAKDSPCTYDAAQARAGKEGNDLDVAIRKFRMAAYLWQCFTGEQMARNRLGWSTFRFDEEWTSGTSYDDDLHQGSMRSEARVHVVRCDKTVAEIRDPDNKDKLFDITAAALRDYFRVKPGQKQYVAALILDAHWDAKEKMILGHVAKGGQAGPDLDLAVFGSHCLHSYPSTLCEVIPAFKDCTPTNTEFVANPENCAGYSWEAAVLGIGAHLKEVGHLLGSPAQESGVMARDFLTLNRTFMVKEAYSTRTKSKGGQVHPRDEPSWHRLDLLRFRYHPLFRLPNHGPPHADRTVHGWVVENQKVLVTACSGLLCAEIYAEGDERCRTWIEYPMDKRIRTTTLCEAELRSRLPEGKRRSKIKVMVRSMGGAELVIDDFHQLCTKSAVKVTSGPLVTKMAFRSTKVGFSNREGSEPQEIVFKSAETSLNRIQTSVTIHHASDTGIHGLEFHYDNGESQLFGKQGGTREKFMLDIRNAEVIQGFAIRAGHWIDAMQIITSTSRRSPYYGNVNGGALHTLFVPSGFKVCGVSGSCADWLDGFSVLIGR